MTYDYYVLYISRLKFTHCTFHIVVSYPSSAVDILLKHVATSLAKCHKPWLSCVLRSSVSKKNNKHFLSIIINLRAYIAQNTLKFILGYINDILRGMISYFVPANVRRKLL